MEDSEITPAKQDEKEEQTVGACHMNKPDPSEMLGFNVGDMADH
jgi:hypothetical protein